MLRREGGRSFSELDHGGSGLLGILKIEIYSMGIHLKMLLELSAVIPFYTRGVGAQTMGTGAPLEPQVSPEHSRCLRGCCLVTEFGCGIKGQICALHITFSSRAPEEFQFLGSSVPFLFSAGQEGWGGTFPSGFFLICYFSFFTFFFFSYFFPLKKNISPLPVVVSRLPLPAG